jgi:hypothetical protein
MCHKNAQKTGIHNGKNGFPYPDPWGVGKGGEGSPPELGTGTYIIEKMGDITGNDKRKRG